MPGDAPEPGKASTMSLRHRHVKKGFSSGVGEGAGAGPQGAAALATVSVGLKPGEMTKLERQLFGSRMQQYLRSRDKILTKWFEDCTHTVDLMQLLADEPDSSMQGLRDAYYFLQENGYINFGVVKEHPVAEEEAAASEPVEDDKAIAFKLYELLRAADMQTTSEKALRKQLQEHFKTDMKEKKAFVKEHVTYFLQNLDRKDTLEPLGFEGQLSEEQLRERRAARKALAQPPPKPAGRVIVVGAGAAGLAAATQLQRNNVDVLVLEARDRVGGRVHSYQGPGFSAPVDLGASLITGTVPDAEAGLGPDPISFVCKQLGIQLHMLGGRLPLYGAAGQQVSAEVDAAVDKLRDELLDAAQEAADAGPKEEVLQQSLAQALDKALQQRLKAAQPEQPKGAAAAAAAGAAASSPDAAPAAAAEVNGKGPGVVAAAAATADSKGPEAETAAATAAVDAANTASNEKAAAADAGADGKAPEPKVAAAGADAAGTSPEGQAGAAAAADGDKQSGAPQAGVKQDAAGDLAGFTPEMLRVLDWHWANLEYGCSAGLSEVSLPCWNQDEEWGGFGGPHAMVVGGFDATLKGLAAQLGDKLRLSCPVSSIDYSAAEQQAAGDGDGADGTADQQQQQQQIKVTLASGEVLHASLVLVTVPLGVLQQGVVDFVPPLPDWKAAAANKLGFGDLNKVVMQFPEVFWDNSIDYFGITQPPGEDSRGRCFMFWNLARFNNSAPLLAALVSGRSARAAEGGDAQELQQHMLETLRRVYGDKVCDPVAVTVTQWASDEFSRGSYSYVAVGATGQEYDTLALPVSRCVLFAGEHTCKEHPDSVGGAMLSGLREAARALQLLRGPAGADAAALVASRTQTLSKTDKRKRMEEADDEARAKKQKRDKKKEARRERKERKKQAGSSDEEEEEEESEGEQRAGGRRRGAGEPRKRRAATQEDPMRRAAERAAMRVELSRLWEGLLDAQQGDCLTVLDVMRNCDSLDSRQQVMAAIIKSSAEALSHLSADTVFLSLLNTWLADLVVERSDANLHVLLKLLEVLALLRSASWAGLTSSGLCVTVKKATGHRNRDVGNKSTGLLKDWESRDPRHQKAPVVKKPRVSGPSVLNLFHIGPLQQSSQLDQQQAQQQARQQQAAKQQQQQAKQQQARQGGGAPAGAVNGAPAVEQIEAFMTEEEREALAARQAALREAQEQAAAAAAELVALEAAPAAASGSIRIESFEKYERSTKRARDGGEGDADGQQRHSKHHRHKQHRHSGSEQDRPDASGGADRADVAPDAKARATKQLSDFVKASLKPRFQAKEIDNADCKWLLQKVVSKVMDATSGADTQAPEFMTAKRVAKVNALLDSYVAKRKAEKKSGAVSAAGGRPDSAQQRSSARVSATARTP